MASSQVEISTSSHHDSCFQNNLDHSHLDLTDLWVHQPQWQSTATDNDNSGNRKPDKWAKAREMVFPGKSPVEDPNLVGGVSSLVEKWRVLERSSTASSSSTVFQVDNIVASGLDSPCTLTPSTPPSLFGDVDSFMGDLESPGSRDSNAIEMERLRVSDIIKRLTVNDSASETSPHSDQQRCPSPCIRGRKAFNDLLKQIERDRLKELEGIVARKPVSKFSHRARIKALLRFRFPHSGMEEAKQDCCHSNVMHIRERVKPTTQESSEKKIEITHESEGHVTSKQHDDVGKSSREVKENRNETDSENNNHKRLAKSPGNEGSFLDFSEKFSSHTIETTGVHNKEIEETSHHQLTVNNREELPSENVSNTDFEWDRFQSDNQEDEQQGSKIEWIYQVTRPRSDWEGLRKERYQEMLDPFVGKEEIRTLLGRKSVSTFLSSSLKDNIDRLLESRSRGQRSLKTDETKRIEKHEIRLSVQVGASDERDKAEDYSDNNNDEYDESEDCADQITRTSSWPHNQESSEYSYSYPNHLASPSTQESPSNYYAQNSIRQPSSAHSSAYDMELIYDLRGHMEQLHQEMSELRSTIKCCVDMQINLQHSIKKEVATALQGQGIEGNAVKKDTRTTSGITEGICCVCCKKQVDSLLYRCGHICTCFECAHKLHWSSGQCPICTSPIIDVVRTYSNHS